MPIVLVAAQASTSTGVDVWPYTWGARFMPPPNPIVARPKTSARSARHSASRLSSGFKNTLNAYSGPGGRLRARAAGIVRDALGLRSTLLASAQYTDGARVS